MRIQSVYNNLYATLCLAEKRHKSCNEENLLSTMYINVLVATQNYPMKRKVINIKSTKNNSKE